jgi:hypothetical protein
MEFDVVQAENAVAGDTATGATKEVITDTGLKVKTPPLRPGRGPDQGQYRLRRIHYPRLTLPKICEFMQRNKQIKRMISCFAVSCKLQDTRF